MSEAPRANRFGFATRLLLAQTLVLVAGASTSWIVASLVGPGIFHDHLEKAGVAHTPAESSHVEEAFASALVLSLVVALAVALLIAFTVTWFFTHRVQRSIAAITEPARSIAAGDYRTRAGRPGLGAEFDVLSTTINQMADRLESVEQTRRQMLSDLAHEMRTPIATIEAHLEAIEDGVRAVDAETLGVMHASTERLARLAQDIRTVSTAEEGQLQIALQPVAPRELVESAIAAALPAASSRRVELLADVGDGLDLVNVDPERVGQVMGNLLDNAIRHSPTGGTVTVSAHRSGRGWVAVRVTDTGDGIAPEHLGHVFDRFYRADTARNRAQGGSGIGLTISRALVEAQRGHLTASSEGPGRGASFEMLIPTLRGLETHRPRDE